MTNQSSKPANGALSQDQVRHVAKLSRLSLSDEQVERFAKQMSSVLDHVAKLMDLDLEGVKPMAHALDITNVLGKDLPVAGLPVDTVLVNAPEKDPPFFSVPKVLGEGPGA
jgi:aspartyl-tRNA(Asn)/glutamyl-tRNA(Gln) amidotransferase subunit C